MALGLGRIPGHSGTSFKHRKVFFGIKAHNKRWKNSIPEDSPPVLQSYSEIRRDRRLKKLTEARRALILIIPILILANILTWKFEMLFPKFIKEQYAKHQELAMQEKALRIAEFNDNGYRVLTRSGELFLEAGYLDNAQSELTRAINIYPYNKRANIAMTKLLLKRCVECKTHCAEAEQYQNFLKSLIAVTIDDIKQVEDFVFVD